MNCSARNDNIIVSEQGYDCSAQPSSLIPQHNTTQEMMTLTPIALYVFTSCSYYMDYISMTSGNSIFGTLTASNSTNLHCDSTSGIQVKTTESTDIVRLESKLTLLSMKNAIDSLATKTGIAIGIWIIPLDTRNTSGIFEPQPIITLGGQGLSSNETTGSNCLGSSFQIAQYDSQVLISYLDNDATQSCRILLVPSEYSLVPDVLVHIVVSFDTIMNTTNIYMNGKGIVIGAPNYLDPMFSNWESNSTLQIFSNYESTLYFDGSIQQLEIFDHSLHEDQILNIYDNGVIKIKPPKINLVAGSSIEEDLLIYIPQGSNETVPFHLGGMNKSSALLKLAIDFLVLPTYGILMLDNGTNNMSTAIAANKMIPISDGEFGVAFKYELSSSDYFNCPSTDVNGVNLNRNDEVILYRIVQLDSDGVEIIVSSQVVSSKIVVVHVNHPSQLSVPDEAIVDVLDPTKATIVDIIVSDPMDYSINRVRVDIQTNGGLVSLNQMYRYKADFISCQNRSYSSWQCFGDGIDDRKMTFIAIPDEITLILHNLLYKRVKSSFDDVIQTVIYDGIGKMCLDEKELRTTIDNDDNVCDYKKFRTTKNSECFMQNATIRVPGYQMKNNGGNSQADGIIPGAGSFFTVANLLFWGLAFMFVLLLLCLCRRCCRSCIRGIKIIPGNFNDNDDEEEENGN